MNKIVILLIERHFPPSFPLWVYEHLKNRSPWSLRCSQTPETCPKAGRFSWLLRSAKCFSVDGLSFLPRNASNTRTLLRGVRQRAITAFLGGGKAEALLCFHWKSRPCPGLLLLCPPWSFSLFSRSPAVWSLHSIIPLARLSLLFGGRRGPADLLTLPFFQEKVGRYQKDVPKVCSLHDGFILIMGAQGLKAETPCRGLILAKKKKKTHAHAHKAKWNKSKGKSQSGAVKAKRERQCLSAARLIG